MQALRRDKDLPLTTPTSLDIQKQITNKYYKLAEKNNEDAEKLSTWKYDPTLNPYLEFI